MGLKIIIEEDVGDEKQSVVHAPAHYTSKCDTLCGMINCVGIKKTQKAIDCSFCSDVLRVCATYNKTEKGWV